MADPNLLDILQAHGQQFLNSFSLPHSNNNVKKRKRTPDPSKSPQNEPTDNSDSTEEWTGIAEDDVALDISGSESLSECSDDFEQEDDDFTASTSAPDSKVIIFEEVSYPSKKCNIVAKAQIKAFMSSKVSKLHQDIPGAPKKQVAEDQNEDDRTNAQNDAILHRLVHTKLLSGSLNPDLEMAPAKRRKALAGRVLEISGTVKLGKGEKSVREKERNKASKSVREGLIGKEKQRARQELEEAKDLGNYHPTLKKLFDPSDTSSTKRRERGLKMGVGKFKDGFLKLSYDDISVVEGGENGRGRSRIRGRSGSHGSRRVGGRGRGRGHGGGKNMSRKMTSVS